MINNYKLPLYETIALGGMVLALFLGAGNIIFPPLVGMQAGVNTFDAGLGFIITAVLFPALAIISVAINGGNIEELTKPLGKWPGLIFIGVCFLTLGIFYGTPRTATISFEVISDGKSSSVIQKIIFSGAFFGLTGATLAKPGKLLEIVGFFLSPLKISALIFIGVCAWLHPIGELTTATASYEVQAFRTGFVNGYQTLDVISALCFGGIITHTLRERGVNHSRDIFIHSTAAAIIAAAGLTVIYICYMSMGSHSPIQGATNGMQIMSNYVKTAFGVYGQVLLAAIITLACLVTAIGLTTGTARYFNQTTGVSYGVMVTLSLMVSAALAVLGLNSLTEMAVPVLCAIYPAALMVVALGIVRKWIEVPANLYQLLFYSALGVGILSLSVKS
ncbi:branched-chain amino acid transport system II carrier protein [Salmonella enterica]|nr:branched-chain amino acid transport system II carrier protein [Salmonella enterica subsp. enterica serovar Give]EAT8365901.1 branched-chain amino acid transport system II carrier protein [Salmonella enterica]EDB2883400.1 branched-chain amino acid transport system II carrier protein [Salmonella enterica]EEI2191025.1 branched-chain amino acid transport system II carrier protein [Salmonella enterica]EEI5686556.1 branched-chain amino acid transport system II carrier protein [Salmonella enterica]